MKDLTLDEFDMVSGGKLSADGAMAVGGTILAIGAGIVAIASAPAVIAVVGTAAAANAVFAVVAQN